MAAINIKTLNEKKLNEFLNSFDTVLTDCDGVLWVNMEPFPGAAEVLSMFRSLGKRVFYVTNNSTKTREEVVEKCKVLNFIATKEEILCTSNLTASYLKDLHFKKKVYIVGPEAIGKELDAVGIAHFGIGPDPMKDNTNFAEFRKDPKVGAVIVGFDQHFSYPKMVKAATYLKDHAIHFIGTNADEVFPGVNGTVLPGTGSIIRCIESCTERKAVIIGKPELYLAEVLSKRFNVVHDRTLMIGDRHNTDILLGARYGFKTLLVLTGVVNLEQVKQWKASKLAEEKGFVPDYYVDALGDLLPYLDNLKSKLTKS